MDAAAREKERATYFDPEEDRVRCRFCGKEWRRLASHIVNGHHVTLEDYRQEFGLPSSMSLASVEDRDHMREVTADHLARVRPPLEKRLASGGFERARKVFADRRKDPAWKARFFRVQSAARGGRAIITCEVCGKPRALHRKYVGRIKTCGDAACKKESHRRGMQRIAKLPEYQEARGKLTWAIVDEIRLLSARGVQGKDLAQRFGVSTAAISLIVNWKTWNRKSVGD